MSVGGWEQVQEESEKALTKSFGKWEHEQRMKERETKREELMQTLGEDAESLKKIMHPHDAKVRVLQGHVALRSLFQRVEVGDDEHWCGGFASRRRSALVAARRTRCIERKGVTIGRARATSTRPKCHTTRSVRGRVAWRHSRAYSIPISGH